MTQRSTPRTLRNSARPLAGLLTGAVAGLLAAAVALGVAQFVAGLTGADGVPVIAVGSAAIDLTPVPVKDFAIQHFGTHDKLVLLSGIVVVLAVFAAVTGVMAMRRRTYGLAGLAVFGAIGAAAVLTRPVARPADIVPTLVGVAAGALALLLLVRAAMGRTAMGPTAMGGPAMGSDAEKHELPRPQRRPRRHGPEPMPGGWIHRSPATDQMLDRVPDQMRDQVPGQGAAGFSSPRPGPPPSRRPGPGSGRCCCAASMSPRRGPRSPASPRDQRPRHPVSRAVAGTGDQQLRHPERELLPGGHRPGAASGLAGPVAAPRARHGRQGTGHHLRGATEATATEADITISCVSNQVGGPYVGNARWLGASLAALLREAGVRRGADQILSTSADGWTCGTPVETVLDGRNALLAVGMNGQPLPIAHGFPARMLVPGLYGYASATKWVVDLEIATFAAQRSYWAQHGYAVRGPIKTESRIDVPKPLQQVKAGRTAVAGVAWAPHRGIDRVEVRADNGAWHDAKLATVPGIDTWRQWVWQWDATPGLHQLEVRATDGTGATQSSRRVPIFPNGATGWDSTTVTVT